MQFELINSLLTEMMDIDRRKHVFLDDEYGYPVNEIKFTGLEKVPNQTIDVYGDKVFVIHYTAEFMTWRNNKNDAHFSYGLEDLNFSVMAYRDQPLFNAANDSLPIENPWKGDEWTAQDFAMGAAEAIHNLPDEQEQAAQQLYNQLLKEKPHLWNDVAKVLRETFDELNSKEPEEL